MTKGSHINIATQIQTQTLNHILDTRNLYYNSVLDNNSTYLLVEEQSILYLDISLYGLYVLSRPSYTYQFLQVRCKCLLHNMMTQYESIRPYRINRLMYTLKQVLRIVTST